MITIYSFYDRISLFHTLTPFLRPKFRGLFQFTDSADFLLNRDTAETLFMVRRFLKPDVVDHELMRRLRDKYKRIVFFNGNAGGGIPRLEVLPYVDLFYNKSLFKDRSLYGKRLYGGELYSDYYHGRHGIEDSVERERALCDDPEQLAKLRVSWNIGVGEYPRRKWIQRGGVAAARLTHLKSAFFAYNLKNYRYRGADQRDIDIHARLGYPPKESIAYQRRLIDRAVAGDSRFLTGMTGQREYNREIGRSKIILSPFGWGELCLRDFEAVLAGALLLKPDMSHLETWPDIFLPHETYVPFDWEAADLLAKADYYLQNVEDRRRIASRADEAYRSALAGIDQRIEEILHEVDSL